jgi:DNA-binding beta-propeller fold protein YncE
MEEPMRARTGSVVSAWRALLVVGLAAQVSRASAPQATPEPAGWHVLRRIAVGGDGGWDYLTIDPEARRIYVSRSTHVMVLDEDSGKVVGDIPDTPGVHGIVIVRELGRGFTSNGRGNDVTIFDLKTLAPLQHVTTGENPDAMVYDAASKRVFVFNGRGASATVIDAASGTVASTIPLGGKPEAGAADGKGHVFVNLEDKSQVVELDSAKLVVEHTWPLAPGEEPSGMALDAEHRRLFLGCNNKMMVVMDADSGKVLATPAIGPGVDGNGFDPDSGLAFSANGGDGTLTLVHEESPTDFRVVANVPTQRGARTMTIDPKTHHVFTVSAEFLPAPAPTPGQPRSRPQVKPDTFVVLEIGQ